MQIVPVPLSYKEHPQTLLVGPNTGLAHTFEAHARYLEDFCSRLLGFSFAASGDDIRMAIDDLLPPDAYALTVLPTGIFLSGGSERGLFLALQTLCQLLVEGRQKTGGSLISCCDIADRPRFSHRGFMLDCARHFFEIDEIKRLLDVAALLKFNVFHWHLADDQGWRFESKRYPQLTERASFRAHTRGDGIPVSGFYTQQEMRDLVQYAAERHIEVVPEIDVPGHSSALLYAMPELGCPEHEQSVATRFGVLDALLCGGNEQSHLFLQEIFSELCEIFPSSFIHIGGDEAAKKRWENCPHCQAAIKELGLANENALQAHMTTRLSNHLATLGRRAIVWNDSPCLDALPQSVAVQFWIPSKKAVPALTACDHEIIFSRCIPFYLDYPYELNTQKKIYECDILGVFPPEKQHLVKGVEAPLWNEFRSTNEEIELQYFPRLLAVAETAWSIPGRKNYAEFCTRKQAVLHILDSFGVRYVPQEDCEGGRLRGYGALVRFFSKHILGGKKK